MKLKFVALLIIGAFIAGYVTSNTSKQSVSELKAIPDKNVFVGGYPECFAGICPHYYSMDVDGDGLSESVVFQPVAMTQGAGKIIVIKNGKKIFETEDQAQINVIQDSDEEGLIITYSGPRDINMNSEKYKAQYVYRDGEFVLIKKEVLSN